jgi:Zn-dependent protease
MSYLDPQDQVIQRRLPKGTYRPSPLFLGFLALFVVFCVLAWTGKGNAGVNVFFFTVSGWLLSLCFHEFAHALVAYKSGDITIVQRGYLQLDPLKYAHWLLSIVIPLLFIIAGGIALPGGAVLIDHAYIRSRAKETLISLAGPLVNLVFAFLLLLPFMAHVDLSAHPVFWLAAAYLGFFQLMAGILNLLPIPGLDGGNAIRPWLSAQWQRGFNTIAPFGFIIVLVLLWQSSAGQHLLNGILSLMGHAGVPDNAVYYAQSLFRFWQHNG